MERASEDPPTTLHETMLALAEHLKDTGDFNERAYLAMCNASKDAHDLRDMVLTDLKTRMLGQRLLIESLSKTVMECKKERNEAVETMSESIERLRRANNLCKEALEKNKKTLNLCVQRDVTIAELTKLKRANAVLKTKLHSLSHEPSRCTSAILKLRSRVVARTTRERDGTDRTAHGR